MSRELTDEEIEAKIKKSIKKLAVFYNIYNKFSVYRKKVIKINDFLKRNMWTFFIIYTFILVYILR